MAKEVRCIMFSAEEARAAVAVFLSRRTQGVARYVWDKVELSTTAGVVTALAASEKESIGLDPNELLAAVLLHCRNTRIPLSNRSVKKLELSNGSLVLVASLNLERVQPAVVSGSVVYAPEGRDGDFNSAGTDASRFDTAS
jgi:hypothetical protein